MSGPKVDVAELRRQEKERLAQARRRRLDSADKIHKMINSLENALGNDLDLMLSDPDMKPSCDRLINLRDECLKELEELEKTIKKGTELLDVDALMREADSIVKRFSDQAQGEMQLVGQLSQASTEFQNRKAERERQAQMKRKKIEKLSNKKDAPQSSVSESDVDEQIELFDEAITEFMTNPMTSKHKNSLLLIAQDLKELVTSDIALEKKSRRISHLFDDYEKMVGLINSEMEDMRLLYDEYVKECFDLDTAPMSLGDFEGKKHLEATLIGTRQAAEKKLSKDYIKRQIDEVMMKHGYDVVRSDMLQEVSDKGQVLYGLNDDTAIDVFVSDDSQVTMRVVGIGFDSQISDSENERLFEEQCAFCGMHPQITAELAMRGVILHTKNHMSPDRKFNKKIQTRQKESSQGMSRAKKELKRQGLKTMRKE